MAMTFAQEVALLDGETRKAFLADLDDTRVKEFLYEWKYWARPEQLTPPGDWNIWLYLAGRGAGKTRTDAEDVKDYGLRHPKSRIAIVAPTYADARDTCIEGDSGLLGILPPKKITVWNRSLGELVLTNGTRYKLFSSEEPERLRGPQHHRAWCEELCAWRHLEETWDNLMFGLRLGMQPQTVISTTPKPSKFLKALIARRDIHITRGNTFDNTANLAPAALKQLRDRYYGTRKGRQELFAEIIDDIEGALWKRDWIENYRVLAHPELKRIVVAIDPPAASDITSESPAEAGICVAGLGTDGHGYMLADYSLIGTPDEWASAGIAAYSLFEADLVVGEVNNGGDMVEAVIQSIAREKKMKHVPFKAVRATRGKQLRAEPVSSLYQRGQVHHVGTFPDTEDQQCNWCPGDKSPDRLDANVWAFTELMVGSDLSAQQALTEVKERQEAKVAVKEKIHKQQSDWYW